jgi:hypothetical protein
MKFLPDKYKAGKIVEENYTHYFIWDESSKEVLDGVCNAPGIEVMVIHPRTSYFYAEDFSSWERMFSAPKFYHDYGMCSGAGMINNQLPLFNVHQTLSFWKRMYANNKFDHYIMTLVGVSLLEFRISRNMTICLDKSQSKKVQHLSKLYAMSELAPEPVKVTLNKEDEKFNYDTYAISFDIQKINYLDDNLLFRGEMLSRYEIENAVKGVKHLPRFLRQIELKKLDLSDIVCDNQLSLLSPSNSEDRVSDF